MRMIAPSVLSADFGNLASDIQKVNNSKADYLHIDVMDGNFVPNISFGFPVLDALKKASNLPLDVHLMIDNPDLYIERFAKAGASILTVHYEACRHLHRTVQQIKLQNIKAGVSLNPHTPVALLKDILPYIDLVLIMSVNPGFGGQVFIEQSYQKIRELKGMIEDGKHDILVEVDGGVTHLNAEELYKAGANILVSGSTIFGSDDVVEAINRFKR